MLHFRGSSTQGNDTSSAAQPFFLRNIVRATTFVVKSVAFILELYITVYFFLAVAIMLLCLLVLVFVIGIVGAPFLCCFPLPYFVNSGGVAGDAGLHGLMREERRAILEKILTCKPFTQDVLKVSKPQEDDKDIEEGLNVIEESATSDKATHRDVTCAICINDYEEGEEIIMGNSCPHMFHQECLLQWLYEHDDCPTCRKDMVTPDQMMHVATELLGQERVAELSTRFRWRSPTSVWGNNTQNDVEVGGENSGRDAEGEQSLESLTEDESHGRQSNGPPQSLMTLSVGGISNERGESESCNMDVNSLSTESIETPALACEACFRLPHAELGADSDEVIAGNTESRGCVALTSFDISHDSLDRLARAKECDLQSEARDGNVINTSGNGKNCSCEAESSTMAAFPIAHRT